MSQCRICGDEGARYRPAARNMLCKSCAADTPAKCTLEEFRAEYFAGDNPPLSVLREFYADYLASMHTLAEYIKATTSEVLT